MDDVSFLLSGIFICLVIVGLLLVGVLLIENHDIKKLNKGDSSK